MTAIPDDVKLPAIEKILEEIQETQKGLRQICRENGCAASTFLGWVDADEFLAERYARALNFRTEADVDQIREIAMAPAVTVSTEFSEHVDTGDVALRRAQIDTLKWLAAKRMPKKYGDRIDHNVDGSVTINVNRGGAGGADR